MIPNGPQHYFRIVQWRTRKSDKNQLDAGGVKLLPGYRLALFGSNDIIERFRPIKIIHRPLGDDGDAFLAQTRLLIEQVLPRAETRWPRTPKGTTTNK